MHCILCGSSDFNRIFADERVVVIQCTRCGLARQEDYAKALSRLHEAYGNAEEYYQSRSEIQGDIPNFNPKKARLTSDIRQTLGQLVAPHGKILDVGCGRGELLLELRNEGFEVFGLEPNVRLAGYLQEAEAIPVVASMYTEDSYPEESFDALTFIQVLEHLEDPLETLQAAYVHLKPGGILVIDVPGLNNPRILAFRLTKSKKLVRHDFIPQHSYYYTRRTLSAIVEQAGFEILRADTGRYAIKSGIDNPATRTIDRLCNTMGVGGITLYAAKPKAV